MKNLFGIMRKWVNRNNDPDKFLEGEFLVFTYEQVKIKDGCILLPIRLKELNNDNKVHVSDRVTKNNLKKVKIKKGGGINDIEIHYLVPAKRLCNNKATIRRRYKCHH